MNALTKIIFEHDYDEEDSNFIVIIASWEDESDNNIDIKYFFMDDESFIPVFSNVQHFKSEVAGSEFERNGVLIKKDVLAKILRGNELLILNPGSKNPTRLTASDL